MTMRATLTAGMRALAAAGVGAGLVVTLAVSAGAGPEEPEAPPQLPGGGFSNLELRESVRQYAVEGSVRRFDAAGSVRHYDPAGSVLTLGEDEVTEGEETVISLAADLLFSENSWDLPGNAVTKLAELVEQIPDGATVQIVGHTDSQDPVGQDFDNQELSENRARAVADAIAAERGDLDLDVSGRGSEAPAVSEDPEDPSTFAANRRVEIRYEG